MKGMMQAVSLYQQQLKENETVIQDLHASISEKERSFKALQRRARQAAQGIKVARQQEEDTKKERDRWLQKQRTYEEGAEGLGPLRVQHDALEADLLRLRSEASEKRGEVNHLRERRAAFQRTCQSQAQHLDGLKSRCEQALAATKAEHMQELSALRAQQTEDLANLEVSYKTRIAELRSMHAEEMARFKCALEDAVRRRDKMQQERSSSSDNLMDRQREGTRLQQQCADARQEVLDLAAQVKALQQPVFGSSFSLAGAAHEGGFGLDVSMGSFSTEDSQLDSEIQSLRQSCKALERDCQKKHGSLEKKQAECERWRRRAFEPRSSFPAEAVGTWMLGPSEGGSVSGFSM